MVLSKEEREFLDEQTRIAIDTCVVGYRTFRDTGLSKSTKQEYAYFAGGMIGGMFYKYRECCLKKGYLLNEEDGVIFDGILMNAIDTIEDTLNQSDEP